ncbi:Nucleic acid-binding protein [Corchorus olitorius]|uniref:Nucleic acid-binding protein n=1 Tax=Corchorus olitorius TaxID=93759 RepID=A0A1R3H4N9_9ROSI|nr:Nucleic acid-binding protein [Corchorus olitorius]
MTSECQLRDLCDGGVQSFVIVRIVRLWDSIIPPHSYFIGIDFLAVDSEGYAMHGYILLDLADDFRAQLIEGSIYRISTFEVRPRGRKTHLAIPCQRLLFFNVSTKVDEIPHHARSIPTYYFSFASYDDIMTRSNDMFYLIDIIGILDVITDVVPIELGNPVRITIWGPKTHDLDIAAIIRLPYKPVLSVSGLSVKYCQGFVHINSCSATKFHIDPSVHEVTQLKQRFPYDGSIVNLKSTADVCPPQDLAYPGATRATIEALLYMNPLTIKGYWPDCAAPRKTRLRMSLIVEHQGFKLQTVNFGDLVSRLTGVNVTTLDFVEIQNYKKIPYVAGQLSISYPSSNIYQSEDFQKFPLIEAIVGFILCVSEHFDDCGYYCKRLLLDWLHFEYLKLPSSDEVIKMLEDESFMDQLYRRGIIDYQPGILSFRPAQQEVKTIQAWVTSEFVVDAPGRCSTSHKVKLMVDGTNVIFPNIKRLDFDSYCREQIDAHLIVVTETRVSGQASVDARKMMGYDSSVTIESIGSFGGMWFLWKCTALRVQLISRHRNAIAIRMDFNTEYA